MPVMMLVRRRREEVLERQRVVKYPTREKAKTELTCLSMLMQKGDATMNTRKVNEECER